MSENLTAASSQWARRPDDERFLSLEALHEHTKARAENSAAEVMKHSQINVQGAEAGDHRAVMLDLADGEPATLTHWSFSQLASRAKVPADFCRVTHPEIAALALNYGLQVLPSRPGQEAMRDSSMLYYTEPNGSPAQVRAITSPSYGRIYDHQVVEMVAEAAGDVWKVPGARDWQTGENIEGYEETKEGTTLYASDRDCFLFLVNEETPVTIDRPDGGREQQLTRGFFVSNSETGAARFRLTVFLYDFVCENRIVWGAENVRELGIRHTSGAPERFRVEAAAMLRKFAQDDPSREAELVQRAMRAKLAMDDEGVAKWLRSQKFSARQASRAITRARAEEGKLETVWDAVQGLTATARDLPHQDQRVQLEEAAGKLLSASSLRRFEYAAA